MAIIPHVDLVLSAMWVCLCVGGVYIHVGANKNVPVHNLYMYIYTYKCILNILFCSVTDTTIIQTAMLGQYPKQALIAMA